MIDAFVLPHRSTKSAVIHHITHEPIQYRLYCTVPIFDICASIPRRIFCGVCFDSKFILILVHNIEFYFTDLLRKHSVKQLIIIKAVEAVIEIVIRRLEKETWSFAPDITNRFVWLNIVFFLSLFILLEPFIHLQDSPPCRNRQILYAI